GAALAGADADGVLDVEDEDLPIARLPGVGVLQDRVERALDVVVVDHDLQLELWAEEDRRLRAPVALGEALLAAGALDLADAHGRKAHVGQVVADLLERLMPDESLDLLHESLLSPLRMSPEGGSRCRAPCLAASRQASPPGSHP